MTRTCVATLAACLTAAILAPTERVASKAPTSGNLDPSGSRGEVGRRRW